MKTFLIAISLFGVLSGPPAQAAEPPLGAEVQGLLNHAREHNPGFAAMRHEAEAAAQRVEPAGALPDPVLRAELQDFTNQGTDKGASLLPSQVGSTRYLLMQSVPWFGKRDLQRGVAEAQAEQAQGQAAGTWADLSGQIKSLFAMRYYLAGSERLARQTLVLLDNLERIARTRYANSLATQQDVIRVQVEKTALQGELVALQGELHHTHARMNALLSRPADAPLEEPAGLPAPPPAAKLDEAALLERLHARNPQLRAAVAQLDSAGKSRDLAYINRYPGFTFGIAPMQSGSAVRSWDLMVELNIPLQQSSRRSQEREAEAMLAASSARKESLVNQIESALSENLFAFDVARRTAALVETRLLPQAELNYRSALAGYETGKVEFAMLIEAQRQTLKSRQQLLQAQSNMQTRLAEIEKLLGEEL